jgi:hypothetical protein
LDLLQIIMNIVAAAPRHPEDAKDKQLREQFLWIVEHLFERVFVRMFNPHEIARVLTVVGPRLALKLTSSVKSKILVRFCSRLKIDYALARHKVEPTLSEMTRLSALYQHSVASDLYPATYFFDDAYCSFPLNVLPAASGHVLTAFCFLRPSSPNPFSNGLIMATNDKVITVYTLDKHCYKRVISMQTDVVLTQLVSSPRGSCVLGQTQLLEMVLLVVSECNIVLIKTDVSIHPKKIRQDAFLSETLVLAAEPVGYDTMTPDKNGIVRLGDLYALELDRQTMSVAKRSFLENSGMLGIVAVRPASLPNQREYTLQFSQCDKFAHHSCQLEVVAQPRMQPPQLVRYVCHFPNSIVSNWTFSGDRVSAYIFVLASRTEKIVGENKCWLKLEPAPTCRSSFRRRCVTNLVVYQLNFVAFDSAFLRHGVTQFPLKTLFFRPLWHLTHLARTNFVEGPTKFNDDHANHAANGCQLTGDDRYLAARFPLEPVLFFPLLWQNDKASLSFNGQAPKRQDKPYQFDATQDFCYIAIFKTSQVVDHLVIGKLCPCASQSTIEEATRPLPPRQPLRISWLSATEPLVIFSFTLQTAAPPLHRNQPAGAEADQGHRRPQRPHQPKNLGNDFSRRGGIGGG